MLKIRMLAFGKSEGKSQWTPWIVGGLVLIGIFILRSSLSEVPIYEESLDLYPTAYSHLSFEKWVVITSINYPTDAIKRLASLPGWHVVVVGDRKSPQDWSYPNCTFLSVTAQKKLPYEIMNLVPYGHYGRKNIGYLFAIQHGAKVIYETDDDNLLRDGWDLDRAFLEHPEVNNFLSFVKDSNIKVVNPYRYWGQPTTWPRGYPLSRISDSHLESVARATKLRVSIQQGLANGDPDMDAIFRLTRKDHGKAIDFSFDETREPICYPRGVMSPFNSQNTLFHESAFWGLMIPITTSFRVCDIWRGYWAQRLLWELNENLAFFPPSVQQLRNPHDYLKDFIDELALYEDAGRLVDFLLQWKCSSSSFFSCVSELSHAMVEQKFWEANDAVLTDTWIRDLKRVGYKEPHPKALDTEFADPSPMELKFLPTSNLGDTIPRPPGSPAC